ncbi:MAG: T9SS type A sorting domain-containing protein [Bacteroidia bacterium]
MRKIFYLLFVVAIGGAQIQAQSTSPFTINSMGGSATINKNIYDWSFAEMTLVNTFSTANLIVTQGVLQNRGDSAANSVNNPTAALQKIFVYPNPAKDILYFESDYKTASKLNYMLIDVAGKTIINKDVFVTTGSNKQVIDLTALPKGIYVLRITASQENKRFIQSYKVQKTN